MHYYLYTCVFLCYLYLLGLCNKEHFKACYTYIYYFSMDKSCISPFIHHPSWGTCFQSAFLMQKLWAEWQMDEIFLAACGRVIDDIVQCTQNFAFPVPGPQGNSECTSLWYLRDTHRALIFPPQETQQIVSCWDEWLTCIVDYMEK